MVRRLFSFRASKKRSTPFTMRKMVYNTCFGGFSISKSAALEMVARGHKGAELALQHQKEYSYYGSINIEDYTTRHDPILVEVVELLGEYANGDCAKLAIKELDDFDHYEIHTFDGKERVEIIPLTCDCCRRPRYGT